MILWTGKASGQVDQKPIGRTPVQTATYTGLFDPVRKLFAGTTDAKLHHYDGVNSLSMWQKAAVQPVKVKDSSASAVVYTERVCTVPDHGARYNRDTLRICWRDKNIAEVLHMTVDEASQFFATEEPVARPLRLLKELVWATVWDNQQPRLSGGRRKGIKLATELQRSQRATHVVYLDEPTTGLHASDADNLLMQLQRLVDAENTVIMIEHDMRAVTQADGLSTSVTSGT